MLLHLGPNVITFRTLLHLGQLLHLGLQHPLSHQPCQHLKTKDVICQHELSVSPRKIHVNWLFTYKNFWALICQIFMLTKSVLLRGRTAVLFFVLFVLT